MTKKLILVIFLFIFCLSGSTVTYAAENTLSLDQATDMAIKSNKELKQMEFNIEKAKENRDMASDNAKIVPITPTGTELDRAFTGLVLADVNWQMSKKKKDMELDRVRFKVFEQYNSVLLAQNSLCYQEQLLNNANTKQRISSLSYALGLTSSFDDSISNNLRKTTELSVVAAKLNLAKKYEELNLTIGLNFDERPVLTDSLTYSSFGDVNSELEIIKIINSNPQMWLGQKSIDLAQLEVQLYDWTNPFREPYRAKTIEVEKAELSVAQSKEQLQGILRGFYSSIQQLGNTYEIQQNALKKAQETLSINQMKYDIGIISKADLLATETEVEKAKSDLAETIYQHERLKKIFYTPWVYSQ